MPRNADPRNLRATFVSDSYKKLFEAQHRNHTRKGPTSAAHRKDRLKQLREEILRRRSDIRHALSRDFSKPAAEVDATEIAPVVIEINHALRHLDSWMKPRRLSTPLFLAGTRTEEHVEPKGASLIISPWNYVVNLTLGPLVSAVAAGCPAILKPSEHTPHASVLLDTIVASVFPDEEAVVVQGDAEAAGRLLDLPFRHIYFTGSPRVGQIVMEAAAKNLASVTLELGGKSPAYIDVTADLSSAAERIAFGKWTNAGQTCIAPDYVLVHTSIRDRFLAELESAAGRMFGAHPEDRRKNPDYARLISADHYARMCGLLDEAVDRGGVLAFGGSRDAAERYVEPTVILDPPEESALMQEEIFGPVLPILSVDNVEAAARTIRQGNPPLSAYVFSDNANLARDFSGAVRTGGICHNETLLHFVHPNAGFGGLATSGIGRAHGRDGFLAFSNRQTVLMRRWGGALLKKLYPPYSKATARWIDRLMKLS